MGKLAARGNRDREATGAAAGCSLPRPPKDAALSEETRHPSKQAKSGYPSPAEELTARELSPAGRIKRGDGEGTPIPRQASAAIEERRKPTLCCLRIQPRPVAIETGLGEVALEASGRKRSWSPGGGGGVLRIPSPNFLSNAQTRFVSSRSVFPASLWPCGQGAGRAGQMGRSARDFLY